MENRDPYDKLHDTMNVRAIAKFHEGTVRHDASLLWIATHVSILVVKFRCDWDTTLTTNLASHGTGAT